MPRRPTDKLPSSPAELDGVTKAAILLLSLGPDGAGVLLKQLAPETVELVTRELASLGQIGRAHV